MSPLHHYELINFSIFLYLAPCNRNFSIANGDYLVSYIVLGNDVMFSVSARTTGWIGIGISDDMSMVGFILDYIIIVETKWYL